MKDEIRAKVEQETADWAYMKELPAEWFGFQYKEERTIEDNVYNLYSYTDEAAHRSTTAYYHEETHEYKLRVRIGLTEFCRIEYIAPDLQKFEELLRAQFESMLRDLGTFNIATISSIVRDKHIMEWEYGRRLPAELEGYELFIQPSEPLRITNGSYVVFDYTDFAIVSNFIIYYNVFRDEFFGEARIRNIPEMNYVFDSTELPELEEKLDKHLIPRLQEVRERAEKTKI
jgi:hypothetical protein